MALIEYVSDRVEQLQFEPLQPYQLTKEQVSNLWIEEFVIVESCLLPGAIPEKVDPDSIGRLHNNEHYLAEVFSTLQPSGFMGVRPVLSEGNAKRTVNIIQPGVSKHPDGSVVTRLWAYYH